jgi:pimeloyl-ACP methyl ester carboxylesterase
MGTALDWRFQVEAFAQEREIIVPDHHYGLTSIRDMAVNITSQLPARFDLVGWSMGGYIVFELFPLVRERVRKVALVHTSAQPETPAARARRQALVKKIDAEGLAPVLRQEISRNMADPSGLEESFKAALVAERLRLGRQVLRNQIVALTTRADARPLLGQICCQCLIVAGDRDPIAPVDRSIEIASLVPNNTLHIFNDVGHCSPWEKTREFNAKLREFFG